MKKTIEPGPTPPTFDPEALYAKAARYIQNMDDYDSDEWEYALWSSLALEFLVSNGVQKGPPIGVEEGPPFQII